MTNTAVNYEKKWLVMAAVAIGTFLATIDGSIVNVALPSLVRELNTNFATVQWVILAYLLTQTTLLLSVGRLGDMLGKKPLFTAGIVVFTLGSVLCGLSPSIYWLISFRVVQAVGAAMMLALGMAIVTEAFPPNERGKAIGLNGTFVSIGIIIGPTLGGIILNDFAWNWIFFVNLPIGLIGTFLALHYIPDTHPGGKQKFDFIGAATLFISLLCLLLAFTWGQQRGFTDVLILLLFLGAALFLGLFLWIEGHTAEPMVDLQLFRNRIFSINLTMGVLVFIAIAGTTLLLPFYLNDMRGFPPRQVGLMMALLPIFLGIVAPLAGSLSDKWGTRPISMIGLVVVVVSYLLMSQFNADTDLFNYAVGVGALGLGMGIFQSPNNSGVMGAAPSGRLGVASGLLAISRTLGQIVGISLLGALWAGRVSYFLGTTPPAGATSAPIPTQLAALSDTFFVMVLLIVVALGLNVWGLLQERR
ncbi:MAG: MFS transporter [Anaerolineales bacterium]|nr:MFS transporter [Anaerolineales bacterium]